MPADERIRVRWDSNAQQLATAMRQASGAIYRAGQSIDQTGAALGRFNLRARTSRTAMRDLGVGFRGLRTAAAGVAGALAAVGAARALRGLTRLARSAVEASSRLVAAADAVGATTTELEALQRVMADSNVSVQQVNQGLGQLTRNIGLAVAGTGTAVDTFRQYGIQLLDAEGRTRSTIAVLNDLAEAISGVSAAERARVLGLTLGEEAARTFAATDLASLRARQAAIAPTLATDEQNRQLERLGNAVRQVGDQFGTLARVTLALFSDQLRDIAIRIRETLDTLLRLETATRAVSSAFANLVESVPAVSSAFAQATRRAVGLATAVRVGVFVFGMWRQVVTATSTSFRFLLATAQRLGNVVSRTTGLFTRQAAALTGVTSAGAAAVSFVGLLSRGMAGLTIAGGAAVVAFEAIPRVLAYLYEPFRRLLNEALLPFRAALEAVGQAMATFNPAVEGARAATQNLRRQFNLLSDASPEIAERFRGTVDDIEAQYERLRQLSSDDPAAGFLRFRLGISEAEVNRQLDALTEFISRFGARLTREVGPAGEEAGREFSTAFERGLELSIPGDSPFAARIAELSQQFGVLDLQLRNPEGLRLWGRQIEQLEAAVGRAESQVRRLTSGELATRGADGRLGGIDFERLGGSLERIGPAMASLAPVTVQTATAFEGLTAAQRLAQEVGLSFVGQMSDGLTRLITRVGDLSDALNALGTSLLNLGLNALLSAGAGALGIPGFQRGGRIPAGQLAITGERGPELSISGSPRTIVSNDQLQSLLGGVTINLTVPVETGVDQAQFNARLEERLPDITDAVRLGLRRGGRG